MWASARSLSTRVQGVAATLAGRPLFWLGFIVAMFSWPILRSIHAERGLPHEHAALGLVRAFTLRDQAGTEIGTDELRGRIWVASFITVARETAGTPSRHVLQRMAELRHRTRNLGDAVRLLTFTLDPGRDTTEHMLELAAIHRASHGNWRFVTGSPARVRDVLHDFQASEAEPGSRVALVDGNMSIRGYYDLVDDDAIPLLLRDISRLLAPRAE